MYALLSWSEGSICIKAEMQAYHRARVSNSRLLHAKAGPVPFGNVYVDHIQHYNHDPDYSRLT